MFQGGHTIGLPIIVLFVGVGRAVASGVWRDIDLLDVHVEVSTTHDGPACGPGPGRRPGATGGTGVVRESSACGRLAFERAVPTTGLRPIHILNLEAERDIKPPQLRTKHHETS